MNRYLKHVLYFCIQLKEFLSFDGKAIVLKSGVGIVCLLLSVDGCGRASGPANKPLGLGTNKVGLVSIGVLNTMDTDRQFAILRFFASNGVSCSLEGSVMIDVVVRQSDVERVHSLLKTNRPNEPAFRSAWE